MPRSSRNQPHRLADLPVDTSLMARSAGSTWPCAGIGVVTAVARSAARGLSPAEREGVKQLIRILRQGGTIILVEHDMDAVFELAEQITVLQEGCQLAEGTPREICSDPRVKEAYLGGTALP